MIRALALIACLIPAAAFAQSNSEPPADMGAAHGTDAWAAHDDARTSYVGPAHDARAATGRARSPPRPGKARSPRSRRSSKFSPPTPRPTGPRSISMRSGNILSI